MAMGYTQSLGLSNINDLMDLFQNAAAAGGIDHFAMNTSSLSPNLACIGRQDVYRFNGTSDDPTRAYVSIHRYKDDNAAIWPMNPIDRIAIMGFTGAQGFDTPIEISNIVKTNTGGQDSQVTCSAAHNLNVRDHLLINGTPLSGTFHQGWLNHQGGLGGTGGFAVYLTSSATEFRFKTAGTIHYDGVANSASSGKVMAIYNWIGAFNATDQSTTIGLFLYDKPMSCFMYYDTYRMCGIVLQAGIAQTFYFGETGRDHVPEDFNSRAFLSADVASGSVTASLSRAVDNLQVGQKISFIHISGSGGTGSYETTYITSRPDSSSFGCFLSASYPSGSLVGMDPSPVLILGHASQYAQEDFEGRDTCFTFYTNMSRHATSPGISQGYGPLLDTGIAEGPSDRADPDVMSFYQGRDIWLYRSAVPAGGRGRLIGMVAFPIGEQSDLDYMKVGNDYYKVFTTATIDTLWCIGIGPGATGAT